MPNKTEYMVACGQLSTTALNRCDKIEHIIENILAKYPEAVYNGESDQFEYRGYKFDYFISGLGLTKQENHYMLVDPDDIRLWLFYIGDTNENWKNYLAHKKFYHPEKTGFWETFKRLLTGV